MNYYKSNIMTLEAWIQRSRARLLFSQKVIHMYENGTVTIYDFSAHQNVLAEEQYYGELWEAGTFDINLYTGKDWTYVKPKSKSPWQN